MNIKIEKSVEQLNYLILIERSLKSSNYRYDFLAIFRIGKMSYLTNKYKYKFLFNLRNECLYLLTKRKSSKLLFAAGNPSMGFYDSNVTVKLRVDRLILFHLKFDLLQLSGSHINKLRPISGASIFSLVPTIEKIYFVEMIRLPV